MLLRRACRRCHSLSSCLGNLPTISTTFDRHHWLSTSDSTPQKDVTTKEAPTNLAKHLKTKIKMGGGPVSVAHFMREALINPKFGYYMNSEVLGRRGDFVTSPEVSQVFGEVCLMPLFDGMDCQLIGIWCVLTWQQMGQPQTIKLIELGPGRGTLMADLLRGVQNIPEFVKAMESVHLVEISPYLKEKQMETLKTTEDKFQLSTGKAPQILWHEDLEAIPKTCPEFIIGHEFLDALPVHQFIKTSHGWRERMVDIALDDDPLQLRFVLAPSITPASAILPARRLSWMPLHERDAVTELEVGSDMLAFGIRLAQRVSIVHGAALMIDYGKNGHYPWSLQGIRRHRHVHVLERPGETDVSAHIDFEAFAHSVQDSQCNAVAHGPIEQRYLLKALGIDLRMERLVEQSTDAQFRELKSGYERLIGSEETGQPQGMGTLYKAMAITQKTQSVPIGFSDA